MAFWGLFIFIIVYVCVCFGIVGHFAESGALFENVSFLTGVENEKTGMSTIARWFFLASMGVTALSMLTSIACAVYASWGVTEPPTLNPPTPLIKNNIPFSILNLAIGLGIVVSIVLNVLISFWGVNGLQMSSVLMAMLLPNKKARKHVKLRVRQLIDRLTVGGNNSVSPIAPIALAVRAQVEDSPQLFTRRWTVPSAQYAVALPEFLDIIDVTESSM